MKTNRTIFALAFGCCIFAFSNAFSIDPISFSTDKTVSKKEMIVEKEIKVQDWMVETELFRTRDAVSSEKNLVLENWMIDGSWNNNETQNTAETELKVEDWMLKPFDQVEENAL
jgi:hypothetical protein